MKNKLYVGNLSFDTTEGGLMDHFASAGTVQEATIIADHATGRSRGFGFVVMSTDAEAEAAIEQLGEAELDGRNLAVNIAREREPRPSGDNRRQRRR